MSKFKIYGNDLKALLVSKTLMKSQKKVELIGEARFNFDSSYVFQGKIFDCGYHAIEIERCSEVWDLISSEKIKFYEQAAKRKLYVSGKVLPRNYSISKLQDDKLNYLYSRSEEDAFEYFWDQYVEKQFIRSYTQNQLLKNKFNLTPADYAVNISPWFFPQELIKFCGNEIKYHFENLDNDDKKIAYPSEGGFGKVQDMLRISMHSNIKKSPDKIPPIASFSELNKVNSESIDSDLISIIPIDILKLMNENYSPIEFAETKYLILDVEFDGDVNIDFTELLIADPNIFIDRVSSQSSLVGEPQTRFLQVEKEIHQNEDPEKSVQKMIVDLIHIMSKKGRTLSVKNYQFKCIPFRRFDIKACQKSTDKVINDIEGKFTNIVVLNRSLQYRNFVDTYIDLMKAIKGKVSC